jgi:hypothetical protein
MTDTSTNDTDRWDTPCGVHHGYVFLSGVMFGFLFACITVVIAL